LHLRLHWLHISKLQFKAGGPNFNAELIPVHSPLLRESCLVSYPPLTYMLKFSGFADLTSCQGSGRGVEPRRGLTCRGRATVTGGEGRVLLVVHRRRANALHASRARSTLVHRRGIPTRGAPPPAAEGHVGSMKPKLTLKQACFQGYPESAVYVQIPVGSRNSASRNAYHTSLRPSSLFEPRHPSLKVVRKHSPCGGCRRQGSKSTTRKGSS
jgi:hypothetical protein